jgi:hypothetical protein
MLADRVEFATAQEVAAEDPDSSVIRQTVSNSSTTRSAAGTSSTDLVINGVTCRCDMHRRQYNHRPESLLECLVRFV